jgi:superfamily II DNA or RNA helicase
MIDFDLYEAKELYPFQVNTVGSILDELRENGNQFNLLYQLPTGGGKTVIFSELTRRYIAEWKKKVLVLTHRIELSIQTSKQLDARGVRSKIINFFRTLDLLSWMRHITTVLGNFSNFSIIVIF